jgi:hypothetical protein
VCYNTPAVRRRRARIVRRPGVAAGAAAIVTALLAGGCGGGERQDAGEPAGTFEVQVVEASFPARQRLAATESLLLRVRNTGEQAVPNLAVTVDGFSVRTVDSGAADPQRSADPLRPVWIVDRSPSGTAYADTWAVGRLEPGQERELEWRVTAVRSGRHTVRWRVAAGLAGRARAALEGNRTPEGELSVAISDRPARVRVEPDGTIVRAGE